jgi:poly(3-hydroxybutyrate) depolymerase
MRAVTSIVALASVCLLPASGFAQDLNGFEARTLQGSKGLTLPYRLFKVVSPVAGTKYPLILFLHGAGERGNNNTSQLMANAGATVWATPEHQAKHAAYVIAPQCPADAQWVNTDWGKGSYSTTTVTVSDQLTTALEIVDAVAKEFGTDPARQYITGLSMGGYGTWDAIIRNPDRFAAALPICGAGDPSKADLIKLLPLWTFHGDADPTVPVAGSREMVTALKAVGSSIKYNEYPGVGHDAWDMTYANEEVIDWLFTFKKAAPPVGGSGGMGGGGAGGADLGGATSMGGIDTGGAAMGGNAGVGTAAGASPGGSSSGGSSSAGTPSSAAGTSSAAAGTSGIMTTAPTGDDAGCSFNPAAPSRDRDLSFAVAAVLGGFGYSQRRKRLAA